MKYYPNAMNIIKWVKEFNDLPDNHRYRLEPDYVIAIQRHSQHQRPQRSSQIDTVSIPKPDKPRVERKLREKCTKDNIKDHTSYVRRPVEPSLPIGMQGLFKNQSSNRICKEI
jgi:hypothetical protein